MGDYMKALNCIVILLMLQTNIFEIWCDKLEHRIEIILGWIVRDRSR